MCLTSGTLWISFRLITQASNGLTLNSVFTVWSKSSANPILTVWENPKVDFLWKFINLQDGITFYVSTRCKQHGAGGAASFSSFSCVIMMMFLEGFWELRICLNKLSFDLSRSTPLRRLYAPHFLLSTRWNCEQYHNIDKSNSKHFDLILKVTFPYPFQWSYSRKTIETPECP